MGYFFGKTVSLLSSLKLSVFLLAGLFILTFIGTLFQINNGVYRAVEVFFEPWIVTQWVIPLPGGQLLLWLSAINILASAGKHMFKVRPRLGLLIAHGGLVLLMVSAFVGFSSTQEYLLALEEGGIESRAYHRDQWDLVAYQVFDFEEYARHPVGNHSDSLVFFLPEDTRVRVKVEDWFRNSLRDIDGNLSPVPLARELTHNVPGIRLTEILLEESSQARLLVQEDLELHGSDGRPGDLVFIEGIGPLGLYLEPRVYNLPFEISLREFRALPYPGTQEIASYESRVILEPSGIPAVLSMNQPLYYQGYTFYQSSYRLADLSLGIPRTISILALRKSPLPWLPYWGTLVTVLGMVIHYLQKFGFKKIKPQSPTVSLFLILGFITLGIPEIHAQNSSRNQGPDQPVQSVQQDREPGVQQTGQPTLPAPPNIRSMVPRDAVDRFSDLSVQFGGRWMPIDTLANMVAQTLGSSRKIQELNPREFMTLALLAPGETDSLAIFPIDNPGIFPALQLGYTQRGKYSYNQLRQAFGILFSLADVIEQLVLQEDRELDPLEQELIRLYQRGILYSQIRGGLNPRSLGVGLQGAGALDPQRWLDTILRMVPLENILEIQAGNEAYHPLAAVSLMNGPLYRGLGNPVLVEDLSALIIRGVDPADSHLWAPYLKDISILQQAYLGWQDGDPALSGFESRRNAELLFLTINPWTWVQTISLWTILLWVGIWWIRKTGTITNEIKQNLDSWGQVLLQWVSWVPFLVGVFGVFLTMIITRRPPITSLGTSILFTAVLTLGVGAGLTRFSRTRVSVLLPLVLSLALILVLLGEYLLGSGDRMAVLPAVLDTNFWLSIHVITIIFGYTGVLIAGILGNTFVLQSLIHPWGTQHSRDVYRAMAVSLGTGLILSFFGTMLGGFWADQSWGRFWGWDPKENGALMIVLWSALVIHLKPSGLAGSYGTALAAGFGLLVTAFSWFGVNLMGQGLHSYGFDQRTLLPLILVCGVQGVLTLVGLAGIYRMKNHSLLPGEFWGKITLIEELEPGMAMVWISGSTDPRNPQNQSSPYKPGMYMTLGLEIAGRRVRRVFSVAGVFEGQWGFLVRDSGSRSVSYRFIRGKIGQRVSVLGPGGSFDPEQAGVWIAQGLGLAALLVSMESQSRRGESRLLLLSVRQYRNNPLIPLVLRWAQSNPTSRVVIFVSDQEASEADNVSIKSGRLTREILRDISRDYSDFWKMGVALVGGQDFVDSFEDFPGVQWTERFVRSVRGTEVLQERKIFLGGKVYKVDPGQTIMEAVLAQGDDFPFQCGAGQCQECMCLVKSGRFLLDEPNSLGKGYAGAGEEILGCIAYPLEDGVLGEGLKWSKGESMKGKRKSKNPERNHG